MRPVYAVQFEIEPSSETAAPAQLREQIVATAAAWVAEWYRFRVSLDISVPVEGGSVRPLDGHELSVTSSMLSSGESLWTLTWGYPDADDSRLTWQSHVTVAHVDDQTEVSLAIRIDSREFSLAPLSFTVQRPRLVRTLVRTFRCHLGQRPLAVEPKLLTLPDMGSFVEETLLARDRRLPVILCSLEPFSRQYLTDPRRLADTLVGLAEVYTLQDQWAGFELTDLVGKSCACFNGAVRVYWPGFHVGDDCFKHRLFLPGKLTDLAAQNQRLGMILLRSLAPIAVARFTDGAVTRRVRKLLDEAQSSQTAEIRRQLEAGAIDKQKLEDELLNMLDDNDTLRREKETAELRVLEMEDENAALKQNFDIIADFQRQPDAIFADSVGEAPMDRSPGTVREALDAAAADFPGRLSIWKTAQDSADASLFGRPELVYRALLAIKELLDSYAEAKARGKSMGAWEQHFQQRGFKYAPQESQTTITRYERFRTFTEHGETRLMQRHLTLGGGDKVNCLQIYFDLDDRQERALVGYCGEHLPYDGART